ncbi:MAG: cellulase [Giesbergeria sp.]|jgi:endoglucanase|nr:cellulase [Simplicispira sp.]MBP6118013.1 cellulase [Giesbergeria sp.]MBP6160635.1 cellulase [Giesbergeria sp.]MBP7084159.1 cellulase [Giesbergeria sp.]MBP9895624.1 cellulase [Giesbergeria sp.]
MIDRPRRRGILRTGLGSLLAPLHSLSVEAKDQATQPTQVAPTAPVWPAWKSFRARFMNEDGRILSGAEGTGQTYSEAQAYALFFALVGNDRLAFDKILAWTENNLCAGDLTARLPAWLWGKRPDRSWDVLDTNPASDADVWIAYALGEAGRLWNERRYRALAALLAARILREETADLPGLGRSLLPAPTGFTVGPKRWRLNPSYMPLQVMQWLASTQPQAQAQWSAIAESSRNIVIGAAPKGFAPDWTLYDADKGFLPDTEGAEKGQGGYNAIRVYLWAGMLHPDAPDRQRVLQALAPMARQVRDQGFPPESIDILSGKASGPAPSGFSAAMLPFLKAQKEDAALQEQRTRIDARPVRPEAYYEQALALFGMGWDDGVYQFSPAGDLQVRWQR